MLKKLFEGHTSKYVKDPSERLVKAGAEGRLRYIEELCNTDGTDVSLRKV